MNNKMFILYCDWGIICDIRNDYWLCFIEDTLMVESIRLKILKWNKKLTFCQKIGVFVNNNELFCDKECTIPFIAKKAKFKNNKTSDYKLCSP